MKKITLIILIIGSIFLFRTDLIGQSKGIELETIESLYSTSLAENREFWVKLPETYEPNSNQKYPVVYLLDGFSLQNTLETVYDNYWGHYLPHMILVGLSNHRGLFGAFLGRFSQHFLRHSAVFCGSMPLFLFEIADKL